MRPLGSSTMYNEKDFVPLWEIKKTYSYGI